MKIKTVVSNINPSFNGGEQVTIKTDIFMNEEGTPYYNTYIVMQSYCNSATFELVGAALTPTILRQIADDIENATTIPSS